MGSLTSREKIHQYIEGASKTECVFLLAYICASRGEDLSGYRRPAEASKGDCKRLIKFMRVTQNSHPDERETLEKAIQFIRREWLQKEVQA